MRYSLTPPIVPLRQRVVAMEQAMFGMVDDQIHIEPVHRFAHGLYAREVTLPAGCVAVGKLHAQEHICVISKGRVLVVRESGNEEIAAPATMVVPAGTKNCVHALEETVWVTIHACEAVDVERAEALLIAPEPQMSIGDAR